MRVFSPFLSRSFLHLPVTSLPPFIFPSITRCRRQFLRKMWPIQVAFCLLISCSIFLCSLTPSDTSSFLTWSVQLIFSSTTFRNFPGISDLPEASRFQHHMIFRPSFKCRTWRTPVCIFPRLLYLIEQGHTWTLWGKFVVSVCMMLPFAEISCCWLFSLVTQLVTWCPHSYYIITS